MTESPKTNSPARADVMLLAAGRGQRLRPLTDLTPKALLPVGEMTLLEHHLAALAAQQFPAAVINLAWLGADIREFMADERHQHGVEIRFSDEPEGALETGGGMKRALPLLRSDPFLAINADVLCDFDFASLVLPDALDLQLVLVPTPAYLEHGDFDLHDGRLAAGAEWTYSGIGCFRKSVFDEFADGRFPLVTVIERVIAAQRAGGVIHHGAWMDVGVPGRLELARKEFG